MPGHRIAEHTAEHTAERTAEHTAEHIAEHIAEHTAERTAEHTAACLRDGRIGLCAQQNTPQTRGVAVSFRFLSNPNVS